jgi:hypothetical protein
MRLWVIVELNQSVGAEQRFTVVGLFESPGAAEMERRNRHMNHVLKNTWRPPVSRVEEVKAP